MDSQSVALGSGSAAGVPAFVQQGQVDWVAFGNTTWRASAEVLQRFASAKVQPVTFGAGISLAGRFQLSTLGQRRMEEAIDNLRGTAIFENALWLGFGYRSLVRTMANTVGGIKCVALCSCLADIHSESFAAWILAELWKEYGYPDQYEPSHSQFLSLVNSCAGVVVNTPFAETIDVMLGDMLWKNPFESEYAIPSASNLRDTAKALKGLFELSRGEVDSISVTGGGECAFIAALAYWLFDLRIVVESDQQELIFKSTPDQTSPQVHVFYGPLSDSSIQIPSATYVLGDCRDVFDRVLEPEDTLLIVRTSWDKCLRRTFGAAYRTLTDLPQILGSYLGSLARIYGALARGEPQVGTLSRSNYSDFGEASYGQGFINTILSTFPELGGADGLRSYMEVAAEVPFNDAMRAVEHSIRALETLCRCYICSSLTAEADYTRNCLIGVTYAVREISRTMACVVHDPQAERLLLPTIEGIKGFSRMGKGLEDEVPKITIAKGSYLTALRGNKAAFTHFALGLSEKGHEDLILFHPLYNVSLLFQGPGLRHQKRGHLITTDGLSTALSHRGVCCYLDGLRSPTCNAALVRLVHILNGHINYKDRQYATVQDRNRVSSPMSIHPQDIATVAPASVTVPQDLTVPATNVPLSIEAIASAMASGNDLSCSYRVATPNSSFMLHPGRLMMKILERSGQVACSNGPSCREELALPCSVVESGWAVRQGKTENLTYTFHVACCIWPNQDDIARCLALEQYLIGEGVNDTRDTVVITRNECLPCCTAAILKERGKIIAEEAPEGNTIIHIV